MTKIISGFPGVGKTYVFQNGSGFVCMDSDSSTFDKADFPNNYIEHIKRVIEAGNVDYLFVSSHDVVRDALIANDIEFDLYYPHASLKDEYLERYAKRGSPQGLIDLVERQWDEWIGELDVLDNPMVTKNVLQSNETLFDRLPSRA